MALMVVGLCAVAILAGCGGGTESTEGASGSATAEASAPKTLKVVAAGNFTTLDPDSMVLINDWMVSGLYAATLTQYGEGHQGKPELAEKLVPNANYTRWTVTLKPGIKFSDGSPITAADVKASLERVKKEFGIGLLFIPNMKSVSTSGRRTAVISFSSPEPNFPAAVSTPSLAIFPAAGLKKGESFFSQPVGAGPYVVDSFRQHRVTMSRNPYYGGEKPGPEAIEFTIVEDPGTRLAEVKTGQANFALDLPGNFVPQITSPAEKQLNVVPGNFVVLLNNKDPLLSDRRIRRAIGFALDREAISKVGFGGEARPNSRYWPEPFTAFREAEEDRQELTSNLAAAKRELKGTACESGCKLDLLGSSSLPWMSPVQLLIQQQLQEIGIEVAPRTTDDATALEQEENSEFQMFLDRYQVWAPIDEFLPYTNLDPGGPLGAFFTQFESKKAEGLTEEIRETPLDARAPIAKELGELYAEEVPWVDLADLSYVNASNLPESMVHGELMELKVK
ncbi:MAG: ABC transporter substrate-binding protein [Actinobacteria bacterium]|nr:ABC transporter substrate-binding protein [Actinomycetota bacterium]